MPYIVDGHNLVPKVPGMSLANPDDEEELIRSLQAFCRRESKKLEVYFDNAPPGAAQRRAFGQVTAYFIRQGRTADEAIISRLHRLGRQAANWTVVSSDMEVQRAAHQAGARILSSEDFAGLMLRREKWEPAEADRDRQLSEAEIAEWLDLFQTGTEDSSQN